MTEIEINRKIIELLGMSQNVKEEGNQMCHCPFHKDNHPSCSVNINKGIFNCFSCGEHGTLRSLYRDLTGKSINQELGIKWDGKQSDNFSSFTRAMTYQEPDYSIAPDVHIALNGSFIPASIVQATREYLSKRCISLSVADSMKMSYASMARSYDVNDPNNIKKYVYFTDRLVVPIMENHKLLSCEGRDIHGEAAFKAKMKSLGKEDSCYKKCIYPLGASTSTLFDIDYLDHNKMLYFMEGIMDLAVLRSDPYFDRTNSTAVFGASISHRQVYLLKQFDFTFIVDNDIAGLNSAIRLASLLKDEPNKKDWRVLIPPFKELGVKDVGDIPVKAKKSISDCLKIKWLNNSMDLLGSVELLKQKRDSLLK